MSGGTKNIDTVGVVLRIETTRNEDSRRRKEGETEGGEAASKGKRKGKHTVVAWA